MSLGVTRQGASAFNQPLTFETSSVTDMSQMFYVRPPLTRGRAKCPVGSSVHTLRAPPPPPQAFAFAPPIPRVALLMRLGVPRQQASAFNQPLSFDTSGVSTDIQATSGVHPSSRVPCPCPVGSSVHAACTATARTRPRAPCVALLMRLGVTWQGVPYTYSGMSSTFDVRIPLLAHAVLHDQCTFLRARCPPLPPPPTHPHPHPHPTPSRLAPFVTLLM